MTSNMSFLEKALQANMSVPLEKPKYEAFAAQSTDVLGLRRGHSGTSLCETLINVFLAKEKTCSNAQGTYRKTCSNAKKCLLFWENVPNQIMQNMQGKDGPDLALQILAKDFFQHTPN